MLWTPASLGSALRAWYRSDQGVTTGTGGVSAWADQSGNSHDLLQSTSGKRPSLQNAGVDFGNVPGVRFASVKSDILAVATNSFLTGTGGTISAATMACALTHRGAVTNGMAISWSASSIPVTSGFEFRQDGANPRYVALLKGDGGASTATDPGTSLTTGDTHRYIMTGDSTAIQLYEDGTDVGADGVPNGNAQVLNAEEFSVGARPNDTLHDDVSMAEIVIVNRALSAGEVSLLDGWLQRNG